MAQGLSGLRRVWSLLEEGRADASSFDTVTAEGAEIPLANWIAPFHSAAMRRTMEPGPCEAADLLERAVRDCLEQKPGLELGRRWLRRRGALRTLRVARRWSPIAKRALAPWWTYGTGGSGPERLFWTSASRVENREDDALSRVLTRTERDGFARASGAERDAFLGELWADWILGGRRI